MADKCPDTCCAKWEIPIDEATLLKYRNVTGNLGNKLKSNIKKDDKGDFIFIQKNKRCPFLTENNLCEIITELGEEYLCDVCDSHPRFTEEYGDFTEISLSLSCPEANRLILSKEELHTYSEKENEVVPDYIIDDEILPFLLKMREKAFAIIGNESISVSSVLSSILLLSHKMQEKIDKDYYKEFDFTPCYTSNAIEDIAFNYADIFSQLEILTDQWKEILSDNNEKIMDFNDIQLKNLISYFVFRYFLKAVNDGDIVSKMKYIVFSVLCIMNYSSTKYPFTECARLYSKETEHNLDNMEKLYSVL